MVVNAKNHKIIDRWERKNETKSKDGKTYR